VRILLTLMFLSAFALAQEGEQPQIQPLNQTQPKIMQAPALTQRHERTVSQLVIPAGTRIPIALKNTISTKANHEGDPIYAQSTFPVAVDDKIIVPAGTYVQGKIISIKPAGHIKGRAEVLIHFTSLIYPSGYTVMLPGSVENLPGAEHTSMKNSEGTIKQDKDTGKKIEEAAKGGVYGGSGGALAGGLAGGLSGAQIGAGAGAAAGIAWALLKRGSDVRLDVGTSVEMEIQRAITVDATRVQMARAAP